MNAGYTYKSGKWVWHQTPKSWFDPRYQAYRANPIGYKVYHYDAQKVEQARAQAVARAKAAQIKADKERRKKDSIWGKIKTGFSDHKELIVHRAISIGVGFVAGVGVLAMCAGTAGLRAVPQFLAGARRQLRHLAALSKSPNTSSMRAPLRLAMHRI